MEQDATTDAFENVKSQVGCCGIWCGSCVVGNGTLPELTRRFEKLLEVYGVLKWGASDFDPGEFLNGLKSIRAIPVCAGCLKGGGREDCDLRSCAKNKTIENCGECRTFSACDHAVLMQHMRSGALAAGLDVRPPKGDTRELIDGWTAELKKQFPSCLLFMKEDETRGRYVSP